jgi:hypothetical protein
VLATQALLGFDLDNKPEMRADMTIACTGLAGAIWLGIKTMSGKVN